MMRRSTRSLDWRSTYGRVAVRQQFDGIQAVNLT